jgi:hypothetical protein
MSQLRERYHFIHNVFANFYNDMLEFFTTYLYPRFEYRVVGTYDKAVEYINKTCQYDRETDKPMLPALVLNPSGEFSPADSNAGGMQYWRYPNLAPTMIKRLFDPIYRDQHLIIHAGFIRIKGEIELIMLLNSFYEYCDLRMLHINMFGGLNRIIYPRFFSSFIILPESFVNYVYKNPYTGTTYSMDWASAKASTQLVRSTARNELVLPLNIKPQISLVSLSDASNRYGGTDNIAEWKLSSTINYELEMPNYLIIESDYLAEELGLDFRYGSTYSAYNDYQPPDNRTLSNFSWDWGLNFDTNSENLGYMDPNDTTSTTTFISDFIWKTRYFHDVTESEAMDSTADLYISLPEQIIYPYILIVNSKYGELKFIDHYYITDNGWSLVIRRDYVHLEKGMILELYVYEKLEVDII